MERPGPDGRTTVLACASFRSSGCPPGRRRGVPKGVGFSPSLLAFEGSGDLVVWSDGPRELYLMTSGGRFTDLGPDYIDAMAPDPNGSVFLADYDTVGMSARFVCLRRSDIRRSRSGAAPPVPD